MNSTALGSGRRICRVLGTPDLWVQGKWCGLTMTPTGGRLSAPGPTVSPCSEPPARCPSNEATVSGTGDAAGTAGLGRVGGGGGIRRRDARWDHFLPGPGNCTQNSRRPTGVVIDRLATSVMLRRACATVGEMEPKPPVVDRLGAGGEVRGTGPSQRHPISIPTQR